jgi:type I restriction enzyme M protein
VKHPALDNHAMGTVFEELVRRFNEENNEEAGEHWTPRDAVKLMANLIFLPIADKIESGTYLLYDGAIGTGGMVTVSEETLKKLAQERGKQVSTYLYGQEIKRICDAYMEFRETEQSKIFPNAAFGYWKVTVERPLRLHSQLTVKTIQSLRFASGDEDIRAQLYDHLGEPLFEDFDSIKDRLEKLLSEWGDSEEEESEEGEVRKKGLPDKKRKKLLDPNTWKRDARLVETANALRQELGDKLFEDHNIFREKADDALDKLGIKLGASDLKLILRAVSWRAETAPPVTARVHKPGKAEPDTLHGSFEALVGGKKCVVEYETDSDLRDTEQVPLLEPGGIEAFINREVLPYTPDAWVKQDATRIGYEISFTRHFYKPQPLRTLEEIRADIIAVKKENEGLIDDIIGTKQAGQ